MIRLTMAVLVVLVATCPAGEKKAPFSVKVVGKGPPMLLVPGLACSGEVWDATLAHFKDRHTCHVVTLAGFAGQPAIEGPFLDTMRDALVGYVKEKKLDRPALVGHSLGAYLVLAVAAAAPDAVGPVVAVDGAPCMVALRDEKTTAESRRKLAEQFGEKLGKAPFKDYLAGMEKTFGAWVRDEKKMKQVRGWLEKSDQATVAKALAELIVADLRDEVGKIRTPVLMVVAYDPSAAAGVDQETLKKRYTAQVAKAKDAKVIVTAEAKHFIMYDQPEWFHRQVAEFVGRGR